LENGYYSYHYNYLTTQLFDDLTRSVLYRKINFFQVKTHFILKDISEAEQKKKYVTNIPLPP